MKIITDLLIAFIVVEHLFFLYIEMFAWETLGKKIFKGALPAELFTPTKSMAANQGLYNGFLAAGLIWTFFIDTEIWKINISIFFIGCVMIAGTYGAFIVSKRIFFIQALPAIVALCLLLL